ncbi:tyrosine-type recombinase/integrase [Methylobacterium fujisawaense]|uniref:tyrosine-type recombinase/integrase n=1 Tax=Methylobacterium fujisawaense TaxID=107400 RepID=UPI0036FA96F7
MAKLTAIQIKRLGPGMHGDGDGLYLAVGKTGGGEGKGEGSRSWVFRYRDNGRLRDMGLGSARDVPLADARRKVADLRRLRADGIDPLAAKRASENKRRAEAAKAIAFRTCAEGYIEAHKAGWRNEKHAAQWTATLATYAYPVFGELPVGAVDTGLVMQALGPIWAVKPETATRVRGRIESILDWATTSGHRHGENPARWKGHLANLLPNRSKVRKVEHHAALPFKDVPAFMETITGQPGVAAKLMAFTILTAARTGEALGARWSEIDMNAGTWTVPAERMKGGVEHRVPLSAPVLALLAGMRGLDGEFVFPGGRRGKPLSNMAMLVLLRRMERTDLTVHGFRSSFRDWASETTHFPSEVVEMALAHAIESKVEAAYRRGDLFAKRRKLMDAWAQFCGAAGE